MYLKAAVEEGYTIITEWEGRGYIDITLDWDYKQSQVYLSMPDYVAKALMQFKHDLKGR